VLLTTQYLEEADALADEISVINHGKVIAHGTPAQLKHIVGGQTISVRPVDPAHLDTVSAILTGIAGGQVESRGRGVLSVPVDDGRALGTVVRRLEEAGIDVIELSLHLPSLDEVFFTLTRGTDKKQEVTV
jgi:oleandomycin transport system ATP-binding protein